jgi:hypothetical protein
MVSFPPDPTTTGTRPGRPPCGGRPVSRPDPSPSHPPSGGRGAARRAGAGRRGVQLEAEPVVRHRIDGRHQWLIGNLRGSGEPGPGAGRVRAGLGELRVGRPGFVLGTLRARPRRAPRWPAPTTAARPGTGWRHRPPLAAPLSDPSPEDAPTAISEVRFGDHLDGWAFGPRSGRPTTAASTGPSST